MRKWEVVHPDEYCNPVVTIWTEKDILDFYYVFWSIKMKQKFKEKDVDLSPERCIEDWVVVNWASEIKNDVE